MRTISSGTDQRHPAFPRGGQKFLEEPPPCFRQLIRHKGSSTKVTKTNHLDVESAIMATFNPMSLLRTRGSSKRVKKVVSVSFEEGALQ